jgi:nucleotide-binding universal stress UspA family protein
VHAAEVDDVAVGIANHIEELGPDLIVMCTHGRGGLRDVLYGSLAQQVVSHGTAPVLLIQPDVDRRPVEFSCRRLLVPMDAAAQHEQGLSAGAEIARACEATLQLLLVVPTLATLSGDQAGVGRLLPVATHELLEMSYREAETYLLGYAAQLQRDGISAHVEVGRGEPAAVIVDTAHRVGADMIVLGTHGRSGMEAFWSGSVAPRVSRLCRLPLLLVPVVHVENTAVH